MYNVWTDADEDRAEGEIYAADDKVIDVLVRELEALETRLTAADALAVVLEAVEWDRDDYCLWCNHTQEAGHGSDCQRQVALREYREAGDA